MVAYFNSDLENFKTIEESLLSMDKVKAGDFIRLNDGTIGRISVVHENGIIQVVNSVGVLVGKGSVLASGSMWDSNFDKYGKINIKNLIDTKKTHKGRCWTWVQNIAGADRAVYKDIEFKLWELK